MKKLLLVLCGLLLAAGCGGEEAPAENPSPGTDDTVASDPGETPVEVVEVVEEIVPYPEGTIDPESVADGDLITAEALNAAFFAWEGKEVTLAGYPYIWYGDSTIVEDELRLVIEPESTDELARANFDENSEEVVYRGHILALRGTFEAGFFGPELNSARFVNPPENLEWIETSPYIYDGEPIPVDQFNAIYAPWEGKEVIVEGYYNSTTTSTLNSGVIVRVDLSSPDNTTHKLVACEMAEEIPEAVGEAMAANRAGVQIRGTIADESFNLVGLENCVVVNR